MGTTIRRHPFRERHENERLAALPPSNREEPIVDLNYLYHRRQVEQVRADRATCANSEKAHRGMAERYGQLIEQERTQRQVDTR